jgi:voltage-gated potassium channel
MFIVWNSLEQETPTNFGIILNLSITGMVFFNVILIILRTEETIDKSIIGSSILLVGEVFCGFILSIELFARIWGSQQALKYRHIPPSLRRIRFMCTFWALFDIINVGTQYFYLTFAFGGLAIGSDRLLPSWFIIVFRIFRFLRLIRAQKTFNGFKIYRNVFFSKWRELLVSVVLLLCVTLFLSSFIYFFEREGQPELFGSIPKTFYFAVVTMSTIGYGDVTCKTWTARAIVCAVVVWNLFLFSIPVTMIAASILEEMVKETRAAETTLEHQRADIRRQFAAWKHRLEDWDHKPSHPKKLRQSETWSEPTGTIMKTPDMPKNVEIQEALNQEADDLDGFMKNLENEDYLDQAVEMQKTEENPPENMVEGQEISIEHPGENIELTTINQGMVLPIQAENPTEPPLSPHVILPKLESNEPVIVRLDTLPHRDHSHDPPLEHIMDQPNGDVALKYEEDSDINTAMSENSKNQLILNSTINTRRMDRNRFNDIIHLMEEFESKYKDFKCIMKKFARK